MKDLLIYIVSLIAGASITSALPANKLIREGIQPVYVQMATYRIGIIDTGFDPSRATSEVKLCKTGHWDYATHTPNINFTDPHGTAVASIIGEQLKNIDYCLVIYQVYNPVISQVDIDYFVDALKKAKDENLTALNLSFDGTENSVAEFTGLNTVGKSTTLFIAAGNNRKDLSKGCDVYPACYKAANVIVVGAQDFQNPKKHADYSNYGKPVSIYAPGWYIDNDIMMAGTSYAAPRALSAFVMFLNEKHIVTRKTK